MREFEICKIDETLGIIFGWGLVSTQDGQPYHDLQGDHVSDYELTQAAMHFMLKSRTAKTMHAGEASGDVLFCFPLTSDVLKSFDIKSDTTGLLIGIKPRDQSILQKFRDGEFTGFSIGGSGLAEPVEDNA